MEEIINNFLNEYHPNLKLVRCKEIYKGGYLSLRFNSLDGWMSTQISLPQTPLEILKSVDESLKEFKVKE